jgi:hypothetical protein
MKNENRYKLFEEDDSDSENNEKIKIQCKHIDTTKHASNIKKKQIVPKIEQHKYIHNNSNRKNDNLKKILCHNILTYKECRYGDKCMYAHNLNEQNIDKNRQHVYDVLEKTDMSDINLQIDKKLYNSLLELTKLCEHCAKNSCGGGYNCKFGACSKKFHICSKDLNFGNCIGKCSCVHLTDRGLTPYNGSFNKIDVNRTNITGILLSDDFFKKMYLFNDDLKKNINKDALSDMSDESYDSIDEFNKSIFER